jgi:hypothetical protein
MPHAEICDLNPAPGRKKNMVVFTGRWNNPKIIQRRNDHSGIALSLQFPALRDSTFHFKKNSERFCLRVASLGRIVSAGTPYTETESGRTLRSQARIATHRKQ